MRGRADSRANILLAIFIILVVLFLDRISKAFFSNILALGESIPVVLNVAHFTLVHNTGIAFGLLKNQGVVLAIIPVIVAALIIFAVYYFRNSKTIDKISLIGFSLILGGAFGNLIDRLFYGYVIDFIDFRIWPVFNIADSAITIGTVLILIKCIPLSAK
ncbi:MAG: signal peptidase II [Candidatus Omnitrophota bacterium]